MASHGSGTVMRQNVRHAALKMALESCPLAAAISELCIIVGCCSRGACVVLSIVAGVCHGSLENFRYGVFLLANILDEDLEDTALMYPMEKL